MNILHEKIVSIYGKTYFNCLITKHMHRWWCIARRFIGLFLDKWDRGAAEAGVELALKYTWYLGLLEIVSKARHEVRE